MMRVALIGTPDERALVRARLDSGVVVVAEFATVPEARRSSVSVDALMVAPRAGGVRDDVGSGPSETLTPRELQVLELLAEGLPNKVIAERLQISDQTVKFHVATITGKLGAANRTDAVRRAVRRGLVVF
jgi:DNA-binding NarL/FixJ family response regulator